ncbi:hypothetical protein GJ744_005025 [Endocarpon pusillum]|uniref:Uncharacterized protein n=1 Tax=Endocarpon pusillum TaxID=364733 RepID=A0A8H7DYL3_9EURO|nr:hypothetical protein GJ744_005025 [Endocarpon pusillum]
MLLMTHRRTSCALVFTKFRTSKNLAMSSSAEPKPGNNMATLRQRKMPQVRANIPLIFFPFGGWKHALAAGLALAIEAGIIVSVLPKYAAICEVTELLLQASPPMVLATTNANKMRILYEHCDFKLIKQKIFYQRLPTEPSLPNLFSSRLYVCLHHRGMSIQITAFSEAHLCAQRQKASNFPRNTLRTLKPPRHNMAKSSTKGNGKNKAAKALLDPPVQVKQPGKAEVKPKEEKMVYTGPQTRSRTKAAIDAELEQK